MRPHYAAWQNAAHCSFFALQKLLGICRLFDRVHIKKEFSADSLQFTKTVKQDQWTSSVFFCNWLMSFRNPLLVICRMANRWWDRHFADRIFMPHGMPKPCLSHSALTSTLFSPFATRQGHILLHSAMRHSVNEPEDLNTGRSCRCRAYYHKVLPLLYTPYRLDSNLLIKYF